jgi:hypothetical protein
VREREIAESPRDGSADSSGDSVGKVDFLKNKIEALLSCPHANPKFTSETQMPGVQLKRIGSGKADRNRLSSIAAPDCIHFLLLQPRKQR